MASRRVKNQGIELTQVNQQNENTKEYNRGNNTIKNLNACINHYYGAYMKPYQERSTPTIDINIIDVESYGILNEQGLVGYVPKRSPHPNWVYNFIETLDLLHPENNNNLLTFLARAYNRNYKHMSVSTGSYNTTTIQPIFNNSLLLDNNISGLFSNQRLNGVMFDALSTSTTDKRVTQKGTVKLGDKQAYGMYEKLGDTDALKAKRINVNIGACGDYLFTTTHSIDLNTIDSLYANTSLPIECKDVVMHLIKESMERDPLFHLGILGEMPKLNSCDTEIYNRFLSIANIITQNQVMESSPADEQKGGLYTVSIPSLGLSTNMHIGTAEIAYHNYVAEGLRIPYIIQRGDVENSGININLFGHQSMYKDYLEAYYKKVFLPTSQHMPPLGIAEPLYKLVKIGEQIESETYTERKKHGYENESSPVSNGNASKTKQNTDFINLSQFKIYSYQDNKLYDIYYNQVYKENFYKLLSTVCPLFVWAICRIISDKDYPIEAYPSVEDFYNKQGLYNEAMQAIYEYQSNTLDVINSVMENQESVTEEWQPYPKEPLEHATYLKPTKPTSFSKKVSEFHKKVYRQKSLELVSQKGTWKLTKNKAYVIKKRKIDSGSVELETTGSYKEILKANYKFTMQPQTMLDGCNYNA